MRLLANDELVRSLASDEPHSLFVEPLLEQRQVGAVSVDLRLGYDFLVSILTRQPAIEVLPADTARKRGIHSFFQETRRRLGERFVLYPHQAVLTTTVEFVSLPENMQAEISVRSSFARLGIGLHTFMQPGWRGAIPLEIFNHGNTPVEMVVGSCVCQARFYELGVNQGYVRGSNPRKYFGTVRPAVSRVDEDPDLPVLGRMATSP